jgi:hypothetical protein
LPSFHQQLSAVVAEVAKIAAGEPSRFATDNFATRCIESPDCLLVTVDLQVAVLKDLW